MFICEYPGIDIFNNESNFQCTPVYSNVTQIHQIPNTIRMNLYSSFQMFTSNHNRTGYQVIDNEIEDEAPPTTFQGFPTTDRSIVHSRSEAEALVHERPTDRGTDLFGGPPLSHHISGDHTEVIDASKISQSTSGRWDHIENLDEFFTRVYEYHQGGGLVCIAVSHILSLLQFIFVISFSTFLIQCVDYPVLFNNKNTTADGIPIVGKRHIQDAIVSQCTSKLHPLVVASLIFAILFWIFRVLRDGYRLVQFYEIHNFYTDALGISDAELSNLTWCEVVKRLCKMQPQLHLIINRDRLTPLDIYQRILRYKNYFVSLVNKEVLPPVLNVPAMGSMPYLSNGLKLNLEWLLFWGPWSPWEGPYALKDDYKHQHCITRLAMEMERTVFYMGIANLVFFPLILLYQILYSFFSYAELVKRDPGALGTRRYSNYGRSKVRHFNELDHELRMRLCRSHKAADQYLDQFISLLKEIIAKNVAFIAGAIFAILALLSAWDEDVLTVEHVLTAMTICGVTIVVCRLFIADENLIWWPEFLMNRVIAQIHYAPDTWKDKAHTEGVRREFGFLFQLRVQYVIEELLSPLITPFVLLFWIRPKSRELVLFFHHFTVNVDGLGDVCSFSQMDIAKHGDPAWNHDTNLDEASERRICANDGKTELSILHFMATNPDWKPPPESEKFVNQFRSRMERELTNVRESTIEGNILLESINATFPMQFPASLAIRPGGSNRGESLSRLEGPSELSSNSLMASMQQSGILLNQQTSFNKGLDGYGPTDMAAAEMSMTTMCLRHLHAQNADAHAASVNYGTLGQSGGLVGGLIEGESGGLVGVSTTSSTGTGHASDIWGVPAQSMLASRLRQPTTPHQQQRMEHIRETNDEAVEERPPEIFESF